MPRAYEVNFDGLIGPTHNYAGLSYGNIASTSHKGTVSRPKEAALQGLWKMHAVAEHGVKQAVLPPQERPDLSLLRRLGFTGRDTQIVEKAGRDAPHLLAAAYSASSMWAANAASVSPSADTADGRVHFTVANLQANLHRSIEAEATERVLRRIFSDPKHFVIHPPLPATPSFGDEGAANHMRLAAAHGEPGIEVFVYGRDGSPASAKPRKFPARHTREASLAIARRHLLDPRRVLFVQQNPRAIDAGVFHNDVVAVSHERYLICHEESYADQDGFMRRLRQAMKRVSPLPLTIAVVPRADLSLRLAVRSYLFNSQLVHEDTEHRRGLTMIYPSACHSSKRVFMALFSIDPDGEGIGRCMMSVRQSMDNGGGPACLRLRVVLTEKEISRVHPGVTWTPALNTRLETWVEKHYRERLSPRDLRDPRLIREGRDALDELTGILELPRLYPFQQ